MSNSLCNPDVKTTYNVGKVKLSEISQSLSSLQNDISNGEPDSVIQPKMNKTESQIKEANEIYNQIVSK